MFLPFLAIVDVSVPVIKLGNELIMGRLVVCQARILGGSHKFLITKYANTINK